LQLIKLQRHLTDIEAAGGKVVGISYDSAQRLRAFATRKKITMPLLSDAGSKTIDAYSVRDKEAAPGNEGVANHAIFIVDQQGVIRARFFEVIYDERPAIDALIKALREAANIKKEPKL
jgi:peroxiredoxin Q/BCP